MVASGDGAGVVESVGFSPGNGNFSAAGGGGVAGGPQGSFLVGTQGAVVSGGGGGWYCCAAAPATDKMPKASARLTNGADALFRA